MAKTEDAPARKPKPKPRAARPSFTPAAATPPGSSPWVYRSDGAEPVAATATPRPAPAVAVPSPRGARVTHALDVLTLPIAVSLMAVLAPVRWLLGPRH